MQNMLIKAYELVLKKILLGMHRKNTGKKHTKLCQWLFLSGGKYFIFNFLLCPFNFPKYLQ